MPLDAKNLIHFSLGTIGRNEVKISVSHDGTMSFYSGAVREYGLKKETHLALYFDKTNKSVAIGSCDEKAKGSRKICHEGVSIKIRCKRFFQFFKIRIVGTMVFDLLLDKESGLLYFELAKGSPTTRSLHAKSNIAEAHYE